MATLDGALAFAEVHDPPGVVAEDLHLDVTGRRDVALGVDGAVAERRRRFSGGAGHGVGQRIGGGDDAHASSAAAGRCLDEQGVADLGRRRLDRGLVEPGQLRRREQGHAGVGHPPFRLQLGAHRFDRFGARPDERELGRRHRSGERCALGQEPVAGVDGVGAGPPGGVDDRVDPEVGVGRCLAADRDRQVGVAHERGVGIGIREDGDGLDAETATGTHDPTGDLAPVGDQQALDHHGLPYIRKTP